VFVILTMSQHLIFPHDSVSQSENNFGAVNSENEDVHIIEDFTSNRETSVSYVTPIRTAKGIGSGSSSTSSSEKAYFKVNIDTVDMAKEFLKVHTFQFKWELLY
jgi:hypothetical protein